MTKTLAELRVFGIFLVDADPWPPLLVAGASVGGDFGLGSLQTIAAARCGESGWYRRFLIQSITEQRPRF